MGAPLEGAARPGPPVAVLLARAGVRARSTAGAAPTGTLSARAMCTAIRAATSAAGRGRRGTEPEPVPLIWKGSVLPEVVSAPRPAGRHGVAPVRAVLPGRRASLPHDVLVLDRRAAAGGEEDRAAPG